MAGAVAERAAKPGKGGRRPKRRVSIKLDMTPMVDIAFLLLIFYMVSTVFAMPQAMEINLPPAEEQDEEIEVKESNLLTIRVDEESRYWWNIKRTSPENLPQLIFGGENIVVNEDLPRHCILAGLRDNRMVGADELLQGQLPCVVAYALGEVAVLHAKVGRNHPIDWLAEHGDLPTGMTEPLEQAEAEVANE